MLLLTRLALDAAQVAKLIAERDGKEQELTALLKLGAKDLWMRDLDHFETEWNALLESDVVAQQKSLRAAKLKGKPAAATKRKAKKYGSDDDDSEDDSEAEFAVQRKKAPAVKKAPAIKKVRHKGCSWCSVADQIHRLLAACCSTIRR